MFSIRMLGLAATTIGLLASSAAAQIDPENPFDDGAGALGDTFVIQGVDLPTSKVRVRLIDPDTGKRVRGASLRVGEATATAIPVEIRRACSGLYQVELKGAGFEPQLSPEGELFSVRGPSYDDQSVPANEEFFVPGEELSLIIEDLGPRRPRIRMGGKRVKVGKSLLDTDFMGEPLAENLTRVGMRVPRKQGTGDWTLQIENRAGSDFEMDRIDVVNENEKQNRIARPSLKARITIRENGAANFTKKALRLNARGKRFLNEAVESAAARLLSASRGKNDKARSFAAQLPETVVQGEFVTNGTPDTDFTLGRGEQLFGGTGYVIHVQAVDAGRVHCAFSVALLEEDAETNPVSDPDFASAYGFFIYEQPEAEEPE